ncbi:MAG: hypothetical protein QOK06_595 [Acidimicrobiaceae bacterium]|jgi:hypothetical protein
MMTNDAYRKEGRPALPDASPASRQASVLGSGLVLFAVCAWFIGVSTKPATRMFTQAPNHRTRRLWKPSQ